MPRHYDSPAAPVKGSQGSLRAYAQAKGPKRNAGREDTDEKFLRLDGADLRIVFRDHATGTKGLSSLDKLVYLAVRNFCYGEKAWCNPSNATLAAMCECTPRAIQKVLAKLEALGIVRREADQNPRPQSRNVARRRRGDVIVVAHREGPEGSPSGVGTSTDGDPTRCAQDERRFVIDNSQTPRARRTAVRPITNGGSPPITNGGSPEYVKGFPPEIRNPENQENNVTLRNANDSVFLAHEGEGMPSEPEPGLAESTTPVEPATNTPTAPPEAAEPHPPMFLEEAIAALPGNPENVDIVARWIASDMNDPDSRGGYKKMCRAVASGDVNSPPARLLDSCNEARKAPVAGSIHRPGAILTNHWKEWRPRLTEAEVAARRRKEREEQRERASVTSHLAVMTEGRRKEREEQRERERETELERDRLRTLTSADLLAEAKAAGFDPVARPDRTINPRVPAGGLTENREQLGQEIRARAGDLLKILPPPGPEEVAAYEEKNRAEAARIVKEAGDSSFELFQVGTDIVRCRRLPTQGWNRWAPPPFRGDLHGPVAVEVLKLIDPTTDRPSLGMVTPEGIGFGLGGFGSGGFGGTTRPPGKAVPTGRRQKTQAEIEAYREQQLAALKAKSSSQAVAV